MGKHIFTPEQEAYIKANYLLEPCSRMAAKFGVGKGIIPRYLKKINLTVPLETVLKFRKSGKTVISSVSEYDDFFRENYLTIPIKTMARMIGKASDITVRTRMRQLGLVVPPKITAERIKQSRYPKGHQPANKGKKVTEYMSPEQIKHMLKTSFQKGHLPHNTVNAPGTIRIRSYGTGRKGQVRRNYKIQYIQIGLADWKPLHRYNWEQKYGPIPKDKILWFKDGNFLNADVENLELITRKDSVLRNSIHNLPEELKKTIKLKNQLTKTINKQQNVTK